MGLSVTNAELCLEHFEAITSDINKVAGFVEEFFLETNGIAKNSKNSCLSHETVKTKSES